MRCDRIESGNTASFESSSDPEVHPCHLCRLCPPRAASSWDCPMAIGLWSLAGRGDGMIAGWCCGRTWRCIASAIFCAGVGARFDGGVVLTTVRTSLGNAVCKGVCWRCESHGLRSRRRWILSSRGGVRWLSRHRSGCSCLFSGSRWRVETWLSCSVVNETGSRGGKMKIAACRNSSLTYPGRVISSRCTKALWRHH